MNERPTFILLKQVEPPTTKPWRLAEVYITSDGCRTRFCDDSWATEDEARADEQRRRRGRS